MTGTISIIRELTRDINELGPQLRALAAENLCNGAVSRLPPQIAERVRLFETITHQTFEWGDLESWLDRAQEVTEEHQRSCQILSELGLDLNVLSKRDHELNFTEMLQTRFGSSPLAKVLQATYGPNWASRREQIDTISGLYSSNDKAIPLHKVQPGIEDTAEEIMSLWRALRERKAELRYFGKKWSRMLTTERHAWLQNTVKIHHEPDSAISLLAQRSGSEPLDNEAFLTPLLNLEDLTQGDVLPHLLQTRSTIHPKGFLFMDSRFVLLGYWCGALARIKIEGRISFYPAPREERPTYGIQFEPDAFKRPELLNPTIGLYQLRAQKRVYKFLVSCASRVLEPLMLDDRLSDSTDSSTSLSLLSRSARMDYRRPDCVDWSYLQSVLEASADEALDDLWRLRTNAEFWLLRMTEMRKNTLTLLDCAFKRIDTFVCLSERIKEIRLNSGWIESSIPCDNIDLRNVISLDRVFRSILNKALESLQNMARPSEWTLKGTKTFCYLFDMIKENDPTLRVIGLRTVLRTIEREMSKPNIGDSMPFPIAQALNDMSVVAVCMQETSNHYLYIRSLLHEYASLANDAETEWNERERPWMSLIESTLKSLGNKVNKLNVSISDEKKSLEERHRIFWNTIDQCMCKNATSSRIVTVILRDAPIPAAPTFASDASSIAWSTQGTDLEVTETQKKRAKGRKIPSNTSRSLRMAVTASTVVEPPSLPLVRIHKQEDKDFWNRLLNDKGQTTFRSWKSFLLSIGFSLTPQLGSGRRFEWKSHEGSHHAIVFHEPHGHNGVDLPLYRGRELWARRLEDHFQVTVVQ
ncbi:hypothetical protein CNMCM8980_000874 [Aspergillus fumigatiaffinis]|nr:hypothetical protein CNMCM8980_000874 [Aspergillus fumigatiaffinis]